MGPSHDMGHDGLSHSASTESVSGFLIQGGV